MTNLKSEFIKWYNNEFHLDPLYVAMENTVEDSPWHRERNVGVHTDMVVSEYIARNQSDWDIAILCGAFACAFHDVGKPDAMEEVFKEDSWA